MAGLISCSRSVLRLLSLLFSLISLDAAQWRTAGRSGRWRTPSSGDDEGSAVQSSALLLLLRPDAVRPPDPAEAAGDELSRSSDSVPCQQQQRQQQQLHQGPALPSQDGEQHRHAERQ